MTVQQALTAASLDCEPVVVNTTAFAVFVRDSSGTNEQFCAAYHEENSALKFKERLEGYLGDENLEVFVATVPIYN